MLVPRSFGWLAVPSKQRMRVFGGAALRVDLVPVENMVFERARLVVDMVMGCK